MDTRTWMVRFSELVTADADRLTRLDSAIGDGDHGSNLDRGMRAAVAALNEDLPPGKVLMTAGRTLVSKTGGASGPLYGTALRRAGEALDDAPTADGGSILAALRAGLDGIQRLGAAVEGDKTIVDAYAPALLALERALRGGHALATAAERAATAAGNGARATVPLQARKGRASYLGPRSVGHQDPGATSTAILFEALAQVVGAPA
jgi:phosphoenolpyruvate---glycerone phosphotransferase subunit DhaL